MAFLWYALCEYSKNGQHLFGWLTKQLKKLVSGVTTSGRKTKKRSRLVWHCAPLRRSGARSRRLLPTHHRTVNLPPGGIDTHALCVGAAMYCRPRFAFARSPEHAVSTLPRRNSRTVRRYVLVVFRKLVARSAYFILCPSVRLRVLSFFKS